MKKTITFLTLIFCISCLSCQTQESKNNYVFFNKKELNSKTNEELKLIRNEVFARKGYVFKDTVLTNHFKTTKWYVPVKYVNISLSDKEGKYIFLIKSIEKLKKKTNEQELLFEVLNLLPLNLGSWEWPLENRKSFKDSVKKGINEISNKNGFFKKKYVNHMKITVNVIDGLWIMKLYKINNNNYYVITDDIVTGGNDIKVFNYYKKEKKILQKSFDSLFELKLIDYFSRDTQECKQSFIDDNFIVFLKYDFKENKILMTNYNNNDCVKTNKVIFSFNKLKKKFVLL